MLGTLSPEDRAAIEDRFNLLSAGLNAIAPVLTEDAAAWTFVTTKPKRPGDPAAFCYVNFNT